MTLKTRAIGCFVVAVLAAFTAARPAHGEVRINVQRELQLIEQGRATRHIPNARHRVAIFSYEDPDRTGLGVALAALAGRTILTSSEVSSLGVLRYEGDLAPEFPGAPGYFDKVDRVVAAQGVSLAVWGRVRRSMGQLMIDTYVQIPLEEVDDHFTWKLQLPARMTSDALRARLHPNRLVVQRLVLASTAQDQVRTAAAGLDELRAGPDSAAPVRALLPQGQPYSLEEARSGWVRLRLDETRSGWSHVPSCSEPCSAFLSAARFAGAMLRFMADRTLPDAAADLTVEARAAADQVRALSAMGRPAGLAGALDIAERWLRPGVPGPNEGVTGRGLAAGGSTFANIFALSRTASLLVQAYEVEVSGSASREIRPRSPAFDREAWSRLTPDRASVGGIARRLARAALVHPRDPDLLHNLAVLFEYAGDHQRALTARQLAAQTSK